MNRYGFLGLLFLVGVLNPSDRQVVNILARDIKSALFLSDTELDLWAQLGNRYARSWPAPILTALRRPLGCT
jgi:hypothetical protein